MASTCPPYIDDAFGPAVHGCRSNFDFTLLFEQSILSIGPTTLLLLVALPRFVKLWKSTTKTVPTTIRSVKSFLVVLLIGVQLGLLISWSSNNSARAAVPSAALSVVAAFALLFLSRLEHSRSVQPSLTLNVYLLASVICDALQLRTIFFRHDKPAIVWLSTANLVLKLFLLLVESRSKQKHLKAPYNRYPPEATSGFFSRIFFWWINPILVTGFRKLITLDDLFAVDSSLMSEVLVLEIQSSWSKYRSAGKYALVYATIDCLRWKLASIIFPRLCLIGFNYLQPFLISAAISFVSETSHPRSRNDGYGLIASTALIYLGIAISTTCYKHCVNRTITAFRGAMVSMIYAKTLELPIGLYDESAALTLMSTDIDRLAVSLDSLNEIWARIIEISIGIWLLERRMGWVCLAPIVVIALSVSASSWVTKQIGPRQAQWVKALQRRVGITSSMLGSMKSVKMMGLSNKLFATLDDHRIQEINLSKNFRVMSLWRLFLSLCPTIVAPLACFVIFVIQSSHQGSNPLTPADIFSSLAIISLLTTPASNFLQSLPLVGMSTGCMHRIQNFLLSESQLDRRNVLTGPLHRANGPVHVEGSFIGLQDYQETGIGNLAVALKNAYIPATAASPPVLHDINFQVEQGTLTMVVGVVGAGKSTLLKAIIGELRCTSGTIQSDSRHMAYCAQTPWLPNSTVREIVCGYHKGQAENEEWYNTVVHACAFNEDIQLLPARHDTIIGSRGVTLSGGQKHRLALARAVYSRLSTVVLDDVLSAIDVRTEKLIVERLLGKTGLLRTMKTTVIFATHAIHHMCLADSVIVIGADGRIAEQGTIELLRPQDCFVGKPLLDPEVLKSKARSGSVPNNSGALKQRRSAAITRVIRGASSNDVADLTRRTGDCADYKYYLQSIGGWTASLCIASCFASMIGQTFPSLWLTLYSNGTVKSVLFFTVIYVGAAVLALSAITTTLWTLYMRITPKSGIGLHRILLKSVIRAPQSFFDETDSGITLNRFSQDMTLIDGSLPAAAVISLWAGMQCLAQLALVAVGSTYMAIICPIMICALYMLQKFYLRTSRQMRFLNLESKSPLYTHFAETLEGLSTIRAFGWQQQFTNTNHNYLDMSQRPYYLLFCIQRWFTLFLLLIVGTTAVAVVALATSLIRSTTPSNIGVSLSSLVRFNGILSWLMRYWIQLETSLGAISRIRSFAEGTIAEHKKGETLVPGMDWPSRGTIVFTDVSASYGDNTPALRDVSFSISHGEKIGICGCTGSGKSSLLAVLLRVLDNSSGTITIDGLDLSTIPREIIRSRLVAIPQEPFFLSGSVRLNADPTGLCSDDLLVGTLSKAGLWSILESRGGLNTEMRAGSLSQGQQQMFCLARAMLRKERKVLVLDEATSNIDLETDEVMQRLIREEFAGWTIITVAHRLDSILNSDRIIVLDEGVIVENGSPEELLARRGIFWEMKQEVQV